MRIRFNIDYQASFGEQLVLNVVQGSRVQTFRMSTLDNKRWSYVLFYESETKQVNYFYSVDRDGALARKEWTTVTHVLELSAKKAGEYVLYDRWNDIPEDSYLYSSAFTDCINQQKPKPAPPTEFNKTVRLKVRAPQLRRGEWLGVLGAGKDMGEWKALNAKSMIQHNFNEWIIDLDAERFSTPHLEFKFVILDEKNDVTLVWESGGNRTIDTPEMADRQVVVYELTQASFDLWKRKMAGTNVPVFALRSHSSFGVGDFGDLKKMVDFVALTQQRVLQVLPINDTTITHTWTDSYPYSCISIFALHPQYADLTQLPPIKDEKKRNVFEQIRQELNELPQIDYERVNDTKTKYLQEIFTQEGRRVLASEKFKRFFHETSAWLVPYAEYCFLRDKNGTADFSQWPDHNTWDEADRKALSNPRTKAYREVSFYYFTQYILNTQMADVHDYARKKGVILKGDIPIGVNRHGCDVWAEPRYFNLNGQAGAPPDDFSVNGQNWGFPTYNWEAMLADGCAWWVRRFQNMSHFFDAYRIDHVLGFFRIWEIPIDSVHGLLGQFSPSLALTREEIASYGFNFQEERDTQPFITDWVLQRVFHERADEVRQKYLEPIDGERYRMKPDFDTQRKVEAAFANTDDDDEKNLRDGLYALISDVLFVRDRKDPGKFHPRISAQFDFIYESLYDNDKNAFNLLYNDYFYRRNNQFWYREAMKKLPRLVEATRMLVCAEDLGMVPDCVPWVLDQLRILSLEIQSMPKDPHVRFGHLSRNPYRSVCTISTHDTATLRQWWDEDEERTQDYYNNMLYRQGPAPHPLPGWLAEDIISRHLTSPSMLCILTIQDWLAMSERLRLPDENAERINIPANPHHYWRYRMHLCIEDLLTDEKLVGKISDLVKQSGRKQ